MLKRLVEIGSLRKSDHLRALVTDTSPSDVPIIFSNDGFYRNMKERPCANQHQETLIDAITKPQKFTVPYRYNILKTGGRGVRRLSLIHPSSQIAVANFYKQYGALICHYGKRSDASIRAPEKIGSNFYVRGAKGERDTAASEGIPTVDLDAAHSNPATYFSYSGFDRAYKFFESPDYMGLEKRYSVMYLTDISKCFSSIYTHTLPWALADVESAKENTRAKSFGNDFDRLMQSMNYSETNGICVGAEVSRVFAEMILGEVDRRTIRELTRLGLDYRSHYEFRRYVDDYFIFAGTKEHAERILRVLERYLNDFNLHLNTEKTVEISRPFITLKSRLVRDANLSLEAFFGKFIGVNRQDGSAYRYPKRIRNSRALLRSLLDSVKSTCFDRSSGYDQTSNYIIGAIGSRITALISDYARGREHDRVTEEDYVAALILLLEAMYFFYNVAPTVGSSLRVAHAAIECSDFIDQAAPSRKQFLAELVVRWTHQFVHRLGPQAPHSDTHCIPLEALNVLLVLGEIGRREAVAHEAIRSFCGTIKNLGYFELVSLLYCMGDDAAFDDIRSKLVDHALSLVGNDAKPETDAHVAHLILDLLACPYVPVLTRAELMRKTWSKLSLGQLTIAGSMAAVEAFEAKPWFINWKQTELLPLIKKKELSTVY